MVGEPEGEELNAPPPAAYASTEAMGLEDAAAASAATELSDDEAAGRRQEEREGARRGGWEGVE